MKDRNKYTQDDALLFQQYAKRFPDSPAIFLAEQIRKENKDMVSLDLLARRVSAWQKEQGKVSTRILEAHHTQNRVKILTDEKKSLVTELIDMESRLNLVCDLSNEYKPKPITIS